MIHRVHALRLLATAALGFLSQTNCKPTVEAAKPTPVRVDGSSTVFLVSEAAAAEYRADHPNADISVGISGTSVGLRRLCAQEIQMANASRLINVSERHLCQRKGLQFVELPIGFDGIVVAVHPKNTWVRHLTVEDLLRMWRHEAQNHITKWSDLHKGWPQRPLHLFGADAESGTFDYFVEAIGADTSRTDYTASSDDSVLVQAVANDELALGFFGFAYYLENAHRLRAVPIDDRRSKNGAGPINPTPASIRDGSYQPLSRPMFLYTSQSGLRRPETKRFLSWYLSNIARLVESVGYIPLPPSTNAEIFARFKRAATGSAFPPTSSNVGIGSSDLLDRLR